MPEILMLGVLGFVILVLARILGSPAAKGARGERRVSAFLRKYLDETDYQVLDDLTLPARGATTQIDHVVISRFGVFVVETKNMTGWVFGAADQPRWTQVIHRKKTQFQNPLRQNYGHVKTVQALTGLDQDKLHNVVVFVGDATRKTEMPGNVAWGRQALLSCITAHQTPVISPDVVERIKAILTEQSLDPSAQTRSDHVRHVKTLRADRGPGGTKCPSCGGDLVLRTGRRTGSSFLGCKNYPRCRGTRQVKPDTDKVLALHGD